MKNEYVYVLLADVAGTTRSQDDPFGVAVRTEEEAKRFVEKGGIGYSQSYCKVKIFDNFEDGIKEKYKDIEEDYNSLIKRLENYGIKLKRKF